MFASRWPSAPNYAMFELHSVSDGAGGAIFGWIKYPLALTGELPQIFVHHVLASGCGGSGLARERPPIDDGWLGALPRLRRPWGSDRRLDA